MTDSYFARLTEQTRTRFWINNPTLQEANRAIDHGAISCTTNPTYTRRMLATNRSLVLAEMSKAIKGTNDDQVVVDMLQQQLVKPVMQVFLPLHSTSLGRCGHVSIQGNPNRDDDPDRIVSEALEYQKLGTNFICKIPIISSGLLALEEILSRNIPAIATEVMSISQASAVLEIIQRVKRKHGRLPLVYITHITGIFDEYLRNVADLERIVISKEALDLSGILVARKQHLLSRKDAPEVQFLGGGARHTRHFTDMAGSDVNITINWSMAEEIIHDNPPIPARTSRKEPSEVLDELFSKLPDFKKAYLEDAIPVSEFSQFGPVQYFRNMFVKAWNEVAGVSAEMRLGNSA